MINHWDLYADVHSSEVSPSPQPTPVVGPRSVLSLVLAVFAMLIVPVLLFLLG